MEGNAFLPLLLITGLAVAVPVTISRFHRLRLPIVVGEILAGIVIGRSGLNIVPPTPILEFLAEFGFAYLMFLSGLEVDFNVLLFASDGSLKGTRWSKPLPLGTFIFLGTLLLGFLAALGLNRAGLIESPYLMALILSTTSLGIVAPVLKERGIVGGDYGQSLLVAASVADFATLLLLTVLVAVHSRGLTLDILLIPLMLVIFVLVAQAAQVFARLSWLRQIMEELSHATAQIKIRGAVALMVAWVVIAEALGVEVILGAFLAGTLISLVAGAEESGTREKLDAIGFGFFIPIFFITVGVNFDLRSLVGSSQALVLVPLLIAIAYAIKVVPALLFRVRFSWSETLAGGFLLSSRLSMIIAASAIAQEIGAISPAVQSANVLVAIVTCTVSPLVFNRLWRETTTPSRRGVIVVGTDQLTELLATHLHSTGYELVVISSNRTLIERLQHQGLSAFWGSLVDEELLQRAGANTAEALVVTGENGETTLGICQIAKSRFQIPLLIAQVSDASYIPALQALAVKVSEATLAMLMALEGALRFPSTFDLLAHPSTDAVVRELVFANTRLKNMPLRHIRLPGNALILSIRRDDFILIPKGETMMEIGDQVALIGSQQSVEETIILLQS